MKKERQPVKKKKKEKTKIGKKSPYIFPYQVIGKYIAYHLTEIVEGFDPKWTELSWGASEWIQTPKSTKHCIAPEARREIKRERERERGTWSHGGSCRMAHVLLPPYCSARYYCLPGIVNLTFPCLWFRPLICYLY